ncbi:MAG: hypothetical protein L0Y66_17135 [Myxococcaceae bacterium]|nr:hypothetical protein [Myxococcaceae bacterium]MCI0669172.1 hypothetical protein [Myxococcaceae bacterium]
MLLSSLLVATLAVSPSPAADRSVSVVRVYTERTARTVQAAATPAATAPGLDALAADALVGRAGTQELPLDAGGAVSSDTRQLVALLLGLIVGFGTGHLVARDTNGFVLFLVVDLAIITTATILASLVGPPFRLLYLGLVASHVIQGLDAYGKAGGEQIIERTRERAVRWAAAPGLEERGSTMTRTFALAF